MALQTIPTIPLWRSALPAKATKLRILAFFTMSREETTMFLATARTIVTSVRGISMDCFPRPIRRSMWPTPRDQDGTSPAAWGA